MPTVKPANIFDGRRPKKYWRVVSVENDTGYERAYHEPVDAEQKVRRIAHTDNAVSALDEGDAEHGPQPEEGVDPVSREINQLQDGSRQNDGIHELLGRLDGEPELGIRKTLREPKRLTEEALGPACLLFDPAYETSGRIALALGEMRIAGPMAER